MSELLGKKYLDCKIKLFFNRLTLYFTLFHCHEILALSSFVTFKPLSVKNMVFFLQLILTLDYICMSVSSY